VELARRGIEEDLNVEEAVKGNEKQISSDGEFVVEDTSKLVVLWMNSTATCG